MSEKGTINLPPELGLPTSVEELLHDTTEISEYLRPSEIDRFFFEIVERCETSELVEAKFVTHTVEGEDIEVFELALHDEVGEEGGQAVLFLDGVHTNEVIGGRSVTELFGAIADNPQIMRDLGIKKFIYHNMNSQEMEANGDWFMKEELDVAQYLKNAHRSALNFDWGYPGEEGGEACFPATRRAMYLSDYYDAVPFPLHNAGIGGAKIYTNSLLEQYRAEALSRLLVSNYPLSQPEPSMLLCQELAPGVYNISSLRSGSYASSLTHAERRGKSSFQVEIPYFSLGADREINENEYKRLQVLAHEMEELSELREQWDLPEPLPESVEGVLAILETHRSGVREHLNAMNRSGEPICVSDFIRSLFYPGLMIGHAMRAARYLHAADYGEEFATYGNECSRVIDKIGVEIQPFIEKPDRRNQVSMYIGALAVALCNKE